MSSTEPNVINWDEKGPGSQRRDKPVSEEEAKTAVCSLEMSYTVEPLSHKISRATWFSLCYPRGARGFLNIYPIKDSPFSEKKQQQLCDM